MKSIILDSSVIAKWFFPSEQDSDIALKIKEDFVRKRITISVPLLVYYEVNNLLKTAIKRYKIDSEKAELAYQGFLDLELIAFSSKEQMELTLIKAIKLDISSYDASYVALAEFLNIPFFTADQKLYLKAKNNLVKELKLYSLIN